MKSLRDEIRLRREKDGFNFICVSRFHPSLLGFHRAPRDFIEKYQIIRYDCKKGSRSAGAATRRISSVGRRDEYVDVANVAPANVLHYSHKAVLNV